MSIEIPRGRILERKVGCHKRRQVLAALVGLLCGCAGVVERVDDQALALGFQRGVEAGGAYAHVIYANRESQAVRPSVLHVYIENDGAPWTGRYTAASDPTPTRPLMLGLMALDRAPAIYLGRPCYFGLARLPPCTPLAWTHARYSLAVVASMAAVVSRRLSATPTTRVAIFGHSGGGTLAVLLAEHIAQTAVVVTLAGNLDVRAWTRWHGYTPLYGSLDPAERPALPPNILQRHYVGSADRTVPPALARAFARMRPGVQVVEVDGFDHDCCWQQLWPEVLRELRVMADQPE